MQPQLLVGEQVEVQEVEGVERKLTVENSTKVVREVNFITVQTWKGQQHFLCLATISFLIQLRFVPMMLYLKWNHNLKGPNLLKGVNFLKINFVFEFSGSINADLLSIQTCPILQISSFPSLYPQSYYSKSFSRFFHVIPAFFLNLLPDPPYLNLEREITLGRGRRDFEHD